MIMSIIYHHILFYGGAFCTGIFGPEAKFRDNKPRGEVVCSSLNFTCVINNNNPYESGYAVVCSQCKVRTNPWR